MSLNSTLNPGQFLIDNATNITISRQNSRGMTKSRSGRIKTSIDLVNPYVITFNVHDGLDYETMLPYMGTYLTKTYAVPMQIRIGESAGQTTGASYITQYQGDLSNAQLANIQVLGGSGANIYIDTANTTGSGNIFKAGDYIKPRGNTNIYSYPYTVTEDVPWSSGNVTVPVHRGIIDQPGQSISGNTLVWGSNVSFIMMPKDIASYTVVPGRKMIFDEFTWVEAINIATTTPFIPIPPV